MIEQRKDWLIHLVTDGDIIKTVAAYHLTEAEAEAVAEGRVSDGEAEGYLLKIVEKRRIRK